MYKRLFLFLVLSSIGFNSVTADDTYVKVTSTSDLVVGGTYILAATESGTTYVATAFEKSYLTTTSSGFSHDGNTITIPTATPLKFELGGDANRYTLNYNSTKYLGYANKSLNITSLEEVTLGTLDEKEEWTYSLVSNKLINVANTSRFLGYYNSKIKAYDSDSFTAVWLYRKVSTVTLAAACTDGENYFGTYSLGSAFVVPSDLTVSEIKVVDGKLTLGNYSTDDVVPANTGVMISSSTAGDHSVTLTSAAGSSVFGSENMLRPTGSGITAEAMAAADVGCKYYRLTMHNGTTLGFYWGAADGVAFALGANKAYLAVPAGGGTRLTGFDMADSETTGIGATLNDRGEMINDKPIYDLQGRRMGSSQLRKGLYIINGKKYIIK